MPPRLTFSRNQAVEVFDSPGYKQLAMGLEFGEINDTVDLENGFGDR